MLEELWGGASDILGEGLSSLLEQILNATIFKLCYYIETGLCWLVGVLMDLFEVFAGLEPVTYNGRQDYLINIFFSNKAINNIYWGMAIIGIILIFVFAGWAVIRKMFDIDGKQQQSIGQILWGAVRSLFLIVGLTLVVSVVISATSILMRQIDYIFNNAYHLDQPMERDFTEEEYAAMGRVLSTVGNYSMVPNSNNRYNLNLCFNDIRSDMLLLQNNGVFTYSYYKTENGKVVESWQSVLAKIAKSTDLTRDVKVDVYNDSVAAAITEAMDYLRSSGNPVPVSHIEANYTTSERTHLDRMVFLLGTFRAAKNDVYNEHSAFDDAIRGPYYYNQGRSIYEYDQVNEDFDIGFKTDYILVWFASMALIVNLSIIILNCVARIFNLMLLYIIAPPFIASSPLDNGGKFKQWTTAFIIQSLSVFGTVIAMQLLLLYLPIVASPDLVLFKDRPLLNGIAQFMLVYGGVEAAKKAGSLVTGVLADQAGMEAIRSGDMSGAANRMVSTATGVAKGVAGAAAGVAGFALSPITNLVKRPFKAAGDFWRKLGSGESQARTEKAIKDEIAKNKAIEEYKKKHPEEAKYLGGGTGETPSPVNKQENNKTEENKTDNPPKKQPPNMPPRGKTGGTGKSLDTGDLRMPAPKKGSAMDNLRKEAGFDRPPAAPGPARETNFGSNRPTLDSNPAPARNNEGNRNDNNDRVQQNRNNDQNDVNPIRQPAGGGQGADNMANGPQGNRINQQRRRNSLPPPVRGNRIDRRNRFGNPPPGNRGNNMQQNPEQNINRNNDQNLNQNGDRNVNRNANQDGPAMQQNPPQGQVQNQNNNDLPGNLHNINNNNNNP